MKGLLPLFLPLLFVATSAQEAPSSITEETAPDTTAWTGTGSALELPVRRFADRAALLPRIRVSASSDTLFARGIPFRTAFLGGHAASLPLGLPQTATAGLDAYVGDVPARYGDVLGAALVVDAARPDLREFSLAAEALRTAVGGEANAGRLAVSVPLLPGRLAFRMDVEGKADANVDRTGLRVIAPDARARIAAMPTVLAGSVGGEPVALGLPAGIPDGTSLDDIRANPAAFGLDVPPGTVLSDGDIVPATSFLTDDDFIDLERLGEERNGQLYGALRARPIEALTFDLAGQWGGIDRDVVSPFQTPLNPYYLPRETFEARRLFGTARYQASRVDVRVDVSASDETRLTRPSGFSGDIREAIRYGLPRETGTFYRGGFSSEGFAVLAVNDASRSQNVLGVASDVGFGSGRYDRAESQRTRVALHGRFQLDRFGVEEVEAGLEWKASTHRRYRLGASGLARRAAERDIERYEDFMPIDVRPSLYYGYDQLGLEVTSESDTTQEAIMGSGRRAPYRPRYAAGFAEGVGAWGRLRVRAGLRVARATADGLEASFRETEPVFEGDMPRERFAGSVASPVEWAILPRVRAEASVGTMAFYSYYSRFARQPDPLFYQPVEALYGTAGSAASLGYRALRLERSSEGGLGARWRLQIDENAYTAEARIYQRRLENSGVLRRTSIGGQGIWRGVVDDPLGFDTTLGFDAEVSGRWGRRMARIAYTYTQAEDQTLQPVGVYGFSVRELNRSPSDGSGFFPDLRPHQADVQVGVLPGGGSNLLNHLSIMATGRYASGRLYNEVVFPRAITNTFLGDPERVQRTPAFYEVDVLASYETSTRGVGVSVFVMVQNALDRRTPVRVYTGSGEAGTDGFLGTDSGQAFPLPALYRAALSDPSHYAPGRRIRIGLRLTR